MPTSVVAGHPNSCTVLTMGRIGMQLADRALVIAGDEDRFRVNDEWPAVNPVLKGQREGW